MFFPDNKKLIARNETTHVVTEHFSQLTIQVPLPLATTDRTLQTNQLTLHFVKTTTYHSISGFFMSFERPTRYKGKASRQNRRKFHTQLQFFLVDLSAYGHAVLNG